MITALTSQIATQIAAAIFYERIILNDEQNNNQVFPYEKYFFYGSMGAFSTLWIFTDVISKGKNLYTLLALVIVAQAIVLLCHIIITASKQSNLLVISEVPSVLMFAYLQCFTVVLQLQLIPLFVAGRYRDLNSPWELPLAGQMLALALIFVLWLPSIFVN
jgi:hypothetical protein